MTLYADDLLLYVQDPVNCADGIANLLKTFGVFLSYKLNIANGVCFPVNQSVKPIPADALPFHLSLSGFKCLGVTISHSLRSLHKKKNFTKLTEKIKLDLQRWRALRLLLVGRIETIKLNALPQILFLFQTLPLFLPKSFFNSLNATIFSYVWAGRPPIV